jgi:hypothetical protein
VTASAQPQPNIPPEIVSAAATGWKIFPVQASGKTPLIKDWQHLATSDLTQIEAWAAQFPDCNWGCATVSRGENRLMHSSSVDAMFREPQWPSRPLCER